VSDPVDSDGLPIEGPLAHPVRLDPFQRIVAVHFGGKSPIAVVEMVGISGAGETVSGGFITAGPIPFSPFDGPNLRCALVDFAPAPAPPFDGAQDGGPDTVDLPLPPPKAAVPPALVGKPFYSDVAIWTFPGALLAPRVLARTSSLSGGFSVTYNPLTDLGIAPDPTQPDGFNAEAILAAGIAKFQATYHVYPNAQPWGLPMPPNNPWQFQAGGVLSLSSSPQTDAVNTYRAVVRQTALLNFAHISNRAAIRFFPLPGWLPIACSVSVRAYSRAVLFFSLGSDGKLSVFTDAEKKNAGPVDWAVSMVKNLNDTSLLEVNREIFNAVSDYLFAFNKAGLVA
jgi:hypothetical protein